MHRAVEEIKEATPFLKDLRLVFLLSKLVIDILKLYCLSVKVLPYAAYTIGKHSVKGNAFLRGLRHVSFFLSLLKWFYHLSSFPALLLFQAVHNNFVFYMGVL